MTQDLGVQIPIPPSANALYRIFNNRVHKSGKYREWLEHCSSIVRRVLEPAEWPAEVVITIRLGKGFHLGRDLDNIFKASLDLLKPDQYDRAGDLTSHGSGVLKDDKVEFVHFVSIELMPPYDKHSEAECWVLVRPSYRDLSPIHKPLPRGGKQKVSI